MTLPQASWPEPWQLPRGSTQGLVFPGLPPFPSLLHLKEAARMIWQAPSSLISILAILSDQPPHASIAGRTAQGPSMMETPVTSQEHCSPGLCWSLPLGHRGAARGSSGSLLCCRPCYARELVICPWRGAVSSFRHSAEG